MGIYQLQVPIEFYEVEYLANVGWPEPLERKILSLGCPPQGCIQAQSEAWPKVVKWSDGMASPGAEPNCPRHVNPPTRSNHPGAVREDSAGVGGVFEQVGAEDAVEGGIGKGHLASVTLEDDPIVDSRLTYVVEVEVKADHVGTRFLQSRTEPARSASEIQDAAVLERIGKCTHGLGGEGSVERDGVLALGEKPFDEPDRGRRSDRITHGLEKVAGVTGYRRNL